MKVYQVGIVAVAVLLAVAGIGFGIAQAGEIDRHVEALDSFYVDKSETSMAMESPIETGSLHSERIVEALDSFYVAKSETSMSMESPIETGSMPAGTNADLDPFSRGGP
ncbi:MAG TPA: hypothetical protein VH660_03055 [Candidatus Deferrimicrobiaceae bacterium]